MGKHFDWNFGLEWLEYALLELAGGSHGTRPPPLPPLQTGVGKHFDLDFGLEWLKYALLELAGGSNSKPAPLHFRHCKLVWENILIGILV